MLRIHTIALLLLIASLGIVAGYLVASSVHRELQAISSQLSAFRQTTPRNSPSFNSAERMAEFAPVIREVVSDTLQHYFSVDDTPCLYQPLPATHIVPAGPETLQDPDIIHAGAEQADAVLTAAIARGTWDRSSAQEFANALYALPDDSLAEAYRKLSQALNNGELQLPEDVDPTLFLNGSNFTSR